MRSRPNLGRDREISTNLARDHKISTRFGRKIMDADVILGWILGEDGKFWQDFKIFRWRVNLVNLYRVLEGRPTT